MPHPLGHRDIHGASADPQRCLERLSVAGCVSSPDPACTHAPAKDGGRQRLLGLGRAAGSGQLRTRLGRAGHVWLRLRTPSACPVVPRLQSSGLSEDFQDVSTDRETPSTGLPSRAGLLPKGGLGLLPSTPTLHREQGPCIWSLHGRVARSYLQEHSADHWP